MRTDRAHGVAGRLPGGEVVAKIDRLQMGILRAVRGQPAGGGAGFAVLLLGAVLGRDELRFQRQCTVVTGCDQRGRHHLVEMLDLAAVAFALRAVGARQLLRAEILRAIERDQDMAAQALERRQPATGNQRRQAARKHREQLLRRDRIEQRTDVIVGRNACHLEQRLAVRGATSPRQGGLLRQE